MLAALEYAYNAQQQFDVVRDTLDRADGACPVKVNAYQEFVPIMLLPLYTSTERPDVRHHFSQTS